MEQERLQAREGSAAGAAGRTPVRELENGQAVEGVYMVRERERRRKRNGDPFLKLRLADATGSVEAVVWDGVEEVWEACEPGTAMHVSGDFAVDSRYGPSLTVRALRPAAEGEYDPADLQDAPHVPYEQLVADLRELVATVQDPHLGRLLERFFGEGSELWERFRQAPAAKVYHQAYRHGLLEHCLSVAQGVSTVSATFPGIDRDLAVSGALLHDIGKIDAYELRGGTIDLTDDGRLHGEIPLGYHLVRTEIEAIAVFPEETARGLLHIVLSHHGLLEHGSPVVPCTREATLVHTIDKLGGTLGSFDRIEKGLGEGERWSAFDRALSASAYFADRGEAQRAEAA